MKEMFDILYYCQFHQINCIKSINIENCFIENIDFVESLSLPTAHSFDSTQRTRTYYYRSYLFHGKKLRPPTWSGSTTGLALCLLLR